MAYDNSACPHCRRLRDERDLLEEEVTQLKERMKAANAEDWIWPVEFGLTATETRLVQALLHSPRECLSINQIMNHLYGERAVDDVPIGRIVTVLICKIRKKLHPHNITVKNYSGIGYGFDADTKQRLLSWNREAV